MINTYKIQLTQVSTLAGPFIIYHTSPIQGNILFSNISRENLVLGMYLGIDSSYSVIIIEDTGPCSNSFTVSL